MEKTGTPLATETIKIWKTKLRLRRGRLQKKSKLPNPKARIELTWNESKEPSPV